MPDLIAIIKDPSRLREIFGASATVIGQVRIDLLMAETPIFEWEIPQQPIDVGTTITDSRYQRPIGVVLDCEILDPEYSLTNSVGSKIGKAEFQNDDWRTKRDKLMDRIGTNEPLTIITPSGFDYSDMMVQSIQPVITNKTANTFTFRISAQKVQFVSSEVRGIDQGLLPDELKKKPDEQAKNKQKKNKKQGQKPTVNPSDQKKSILKKLVEQGTALLGG
jgi:hypothetical protein